MRQIADRTEEQAKTTITNWGDKGGGLLRTDTDTDAVSCKKVGGLYVNWDIWEDRKTARAGCAPD